MGVKPRSLDEFLESQKKAPDCPVCKLPEDVLQQMAAASAKRVRRPVVLAWLNDEHQAGITDADLNRHYSGRHR